MPIEFVPDDDCLFLDTFSKVSNGRTYPEKWGVRQEARDRKMASGRFGILFGRFEIRQVNGWREILLTGEPMPVGVNLYYTVRELTNHAPELWALRSLGDEIFETGGVDIYNDPQATKKGQKVGHHFFEVCGIVLSVMLFFATAFAASFDLADGLCFYLPFDGDANALVAKGNPMEMLVGIDAVFVKGKVGRAIHW